MAAKNGNHIYITGVDTLESVATSINDAAYCTWNVGTQTLTVFGTAAINRYFRVRNGGILTINGGETLLFSNATTQDTRFYVDAGSHLIMNDDATIDGSGGGLRPYFWYIYGRVTCNANIPLELRPTFKNFYRIYLYETSNNNNFPNDIWDFTGAFMGGASINNGYAFYLHLAGKVRNHIFKDMIFDENVDSNLDTYGFAMIYGIQGLENITFDNIEFRDVERAFHIPGGGSIKVTNCSFNDSSNSWTTLHYGSMQDQGRYKLRSYGYHNETPYGQTFAMYEGCSWLNGNNANEMNVSYGGQVLIKDCNWLEPRGDSIESKYQGRVLQWTGNTFTDANPFDIQQNGERSIVYKLDITVQDELGNPIEDAIVNIRQFENRERFTFYTNINGKLHAIHNLEGAMLTHQSFYTNTSFQTWSSITQPHSFEIKVDGYDTFTQTVVMDQNRTIIAQLSLAGSTPQIKNFSQSDKINFEC